jgi:DNA-binding CsgD family transcriptional regulator
VLLSVTIGFASCQYGHSQSTGQRRLSGHSSWGRTELEHIDFRGERLAARSGLNDVLAECFTAIVAPELWPDAMERLAHGLGAAGVCFHQRGSTIDQRLRTPASGNYRELVDAMATGGWGPLDLRALRGWPLAARGQSIITETDISSADERERLPIYAELFQAHDAGYLAAAIIHAADELWAFNLVRPRALAGMDDLDRDLLGLARPYLARMLTLSKALSTAAAKGALSALESSGAAAVLLGAGGRVTHVTTRAVGLLGEGLEVRGGRLAADGAAENACLQARIAAALSGEGAPLGVDAGPFHLPGPGGAALLADVTPLRGDFAEAFGRSTALVLLWDSSARRRPRADLLRQLYGLTPREAEVAALLATGQDLQEISEAMNLKLSSVRQLVKALFWKTGASRQSELVAALGALPQDG